MIFEHEIPSGSKLYFGQSARIKREIEFVSAEMLENLGFEEIVTPLFSYHQHEYFEDNSTADVVRIATKRLGRTTESQKWFYIQPTLSFPTKEQYQVGAEILGGSFEEIVRTSSMLLNEIGASPLLQVANIRIPHLLNEKYGVSLELLKAMHVEQIMKSDLPWIEQLVRLNTIEDLEDLSAFPDDIREELEKIKVATLTVAYERMVISPLFYAKMRYYDSLTFRMFEGNSLLAMGGIYTIDGMEAAGFALYTDECIVSKLNREEK